MLFAIGAALLLSAFVLYACNRPTLRRRAAKYRWHGFTVQKWDR